LSTLEKLFEGLLNLSWQNVVMIAIGLILIFLAIKKEYEPLLLLPMGFGAIIANIPLSAAIAEEGFLSILYNAGISTELFPILIFIAVGAMIDFSPLLKQPVMIFFGAAAQVGIFLAFLLACGVNFISPTFTLKEAAAIGIIGAADGPTSIYVATIFAPKFLAAISVAAYSYMSLVPIIQPPVIKLLTTKEERKIRMDADFNKKVSRPVLVLFPIVVTIIAGIFAPISTALIGALMFGNLLRESLVTDKLSETAQNAMGNIVTLLLGITIGSSMKGSDFLTPTTIIILIIGLLAFALDTAGGVLFAKLINLFSRKKVNPMIGACGISAFPMSARIVQKMAQKEDPTNFILMPAISANVSGQIGSIVAGTIIIALLS
jgi:sodium ion-translocating decarboxylase beta subunit